MTTKRKVIRGRVTEPNTLAVANLVKLLAEGTRSCQELADECGLGRLTVYKYCRALHQVGAIHIAMWEKDGRGKDSIKIYQLGEGRDAKRMRQDKNANRDGRRQALTVARALQGEARVLQ